MPWPIARAATLRRRRNGRASRWLSRRRASGQAHGSPLSRPSGGDEGRVPRRRSHIGSPDMLFSRRPPTWAATLGVIARGARRDRAALARVWEVVAFGSNSGDLRMRVYAPPKLHQADRWSSSCTAVASRPRRSPIPVGLRWRVNWGSHCCCRNSFTMTIAAAASTGSAPMTSVEAAVRRCRSARCCASRSYVTHPLQSGSSLLDLPRAAAWPLRCWPPLLRCSRQAALPRACRLAAQKPRWGR